jgi:hypothetical protein
VFRDVQLIKRLTGIRFFLKLGSSYFAMKIMAQRYKGTEVQRYNGTREQGHKGVKAKKKLCEVI